MREALLFCEDTAHAQVISALVARVASDQQTEVACAIRTAKGGHGKMLHELRQYIGGIARWAALNTRPTL